MSETPPVYLAGPAPVPLFQCALAGFQFYGGERCWDRLRLYDPLILRREPKNPHDPRAVRVEWCDVVLGYVPRESNDTVAQMLDAGKRVHARIVQLLPYAGPWKRVTMEISWFPEAEAETVVERPKPGPPPPPASELLVRSLANRIFGAPPRERAIDWVKGRVEAVALVGVELPAMLPFLRIVEADPDARSAPDPLAALRELLDDAGIEPNAWKRLPRWGFAAFERLEHNPAPDRIADFANLLLGLDVQGAPPAAFAEYADLALCAYWPEFEYTDLPLWFMRALLKAVEGVATPAMEAALDEDLACACRWLAETDPSPDANQQRAGWRWIMAQVRAHRAAWESAASEPWAVPTGEITVGRWWIVPLRTRVELHDEADAMENCLATYEADCRAGTVVIFSIRDALTSERVGCFSVGRRGTDDAWQVGEVNGPHNEPLDDEFVELAEQVAAGMRATALLVAIARGSRPSSHLLVEAPRHDSQ